MSDVEAILRRSFIITKILAKVKYQTKKHKINTIPLVVPFYFQNFDKPNHKPHTMEIEKRIANAKSYVDDVADTIKRYISNKDDYPQDSHLIVQPVLCETLIDDPRYSKDCDIYDLRMFIKTGEDGAQKPDLEHIWRLAEIYYK